MDKQTPVIYISVQLCASNKKQQGFYVLYISLAYSELCFHVRIQQKTPIFMEGFFRKYITGWWFQTFLEFSPLKLGKISNLTHIFWKGLKPPTRLCAQIRVCFYTAAFWATGKKALKTSVTKSLGEVRFRPWNFKDYYLSWMRTMEPLLAKYMGSVGTTCKYFESKKHRLHLKQTVPFCEDQWRAHGKLES